MGLAGGSRHGPGPSAELNGYPGPLHVLELADQLELSTDVRERVRQLYDAMRAEAIPIGEALITHETALDHAFAGRSISPSTLALLTAQIGETQGRLRAIHLKYHLTTAELLSADQRHRYAELRGYH